MNFSALTRRFIKRGEIGQTLIIMAIGFVVLLGFVGLVTDVSLMFVRYSTLRRGIDAASVAAAGQVRRLAVTPAEMTKAGGNPDVAAGYAFARNISNVNLAARQFLQAYGLDPTTVIVDSCSTLPTDPDLCTSDHRKLIRVTAQVPSPTVFLRLLGWNNITLEASATSETAVLDVVMIFDVSESQAYQTTYSDWYYAGYKIQYLPPRVATNPFKIWQGKGTSAANSPYQGADFKAVYRDLLLKTQAALDTSGWGSPLAFVPPVPPAKDVNGNPVPPPSYTVTPYAANSGTKNIAGLTPNRTDCQVKYFPLAWYGGVAVPGWLRNQFNSYPGIAASYDAGQTMYPGVSDGWVNTYNYFDCCNDPNGDYDFSDLICQPFKQIRDASLQFLNRIDFPRGDRVAFVTFDRSAYLLKPGVRGVGETYDDVPAMITDKGGIAAQKIAEDLVKHNVGVRAEPYFYADVNDDGYWDKTVIYGKYIPPAKVKPGDQVGMPIDRSYLYGNIIGSLNTYPVANNCPLQNAAMDDPYSIYSMPASPDPLYDGTKPYQYPNRLANNSTILMHPNLNDPTWNNTIKPADNAKNSKALYTYELYASCSGSNVGSALRTANNALLDPKTVRTNGSVWVMVMLGDGAAAASDPVYRNGSKLKIPQPYVNPPVPGDYGSFGLCPYGTPANRTGFTRDWTQPPTFPFCSDPDPATRHFCFDPNKKEADGSIYIDLNTDAPNCENYYDVDDYARDWADYIGLSDPEPWITGTLAARNNLQLPTIFTIGFGLPFKNGTVQCKGAGNLDPDNCLGEELLRYIADVGDNNRMDMNYEQDMRADKYQDWKLRPGEKWTGRGPCEDEIVGGYADPDAAKAAGASLNDLVNPKPAQQSCGNYYYAPGGPQLNKVFDDIASRMFTRISK